MIKLTKNSFYREEETKKALCEFIMNAKQLSLGAQCAEFEEKFAKWQKRAYCVFFNSGSSANLALIQALINQGKIKVGDKAAFSAITWPTNIMPFIQLGIKPVPVDIELETLNISLKKVQEAYDREPFSLLFITNLLGFCDNIDEIAKFCKEKNILFLEDNCEALGSEYKGVKLGNYSHASTFSTFVGHHMSTIEGGMVCTDDKELARELRMVRSHGWDRHLPTEDQIMLRKKYHVPSFYDKYTFYDLAYNIRPTEIQGFLGIYQLAYLDEIVRKREKNYTCLSALYEKNPDFQKIKVLTGKNSNFAFPIVCSNKAIQQKYIDICNKEGIEVRPIVGGSMTEQPFYKKYVPGSYSLPNAKQVNDLGFYFANNAEMTDKEIEFIIKKLS